MSLIKYNYISDFKYKYKYICTNILKKDNKKYPT